MTELFCGKQIKLTWMEVCGEDSQKLGGTANWGEGDREDFEC